MLVDDEMQVIQAEYFPQDDHFVNYMKAIRESEDSEIDSKISFMYKFCCSYGVYCRKK